VKVGVRRVLEETSMSSRPAILAVKIPANVSAINIY